MNDMFDYLDRWINMIDQGPSSYLPYDIVLMGDGVAKVNVAVAGFDRSELDVYVKGDKLVIEGRQSRDEEDSEAKYPRYVHRGIAKRKFRQMFTIDSGSVIDAELENGILSVLLTARDGSAGRKQIEIN